MLDVLVKYWSPIALLLQVALFVVIKFNDMAHMHKEVKRMDNTVQDLCKDFNAHKDVHAKEAVETADRLARIETLVEFLVERAKDKSNDQS